MRVQKDWQGKSSADNNTKHHAHLATFEVFSIFIWRVFFLWASFSCFTFLYYVAWVYVQREEDFLWEISHFLMQRIAHNFWDGILVLDDDTLLADLIKFPAKFTHFVNTSLIYHVLILLLGNLRHIFFSFLIFPSSQSAKPRKLN